MTLHLIRHASAGQRGTWPGTDDIDRPLDGVGRAQAEALAGALYGATVRRVLSSRAVRCQQTVAPLAAVHGLEVETHEALHEGSDPRHLVDLLRDVAFGEGDVVLCSHGDMIPGTLDVLVHEGCALSGRGCEKGSVWELEVRGRDIVAARYVGIPAPAPGQPTGA